MPPKKLIKKGNAYLLLSSKKLKFLDMQALISPHASYSNWLKSLHIPGAAKSFFPFSWFDSLEKLKETRLPDRKWWTNDIRQEKLTDEEWEEINSAWKTNGMKTMRCFLEYYNNKDVSHFIQGIQKQQEFWKEQGICMISQGVSLSGLSLKLFDKHIPPDVYFGLLQKNEENFISYLRQSICGGLAQVFRRVHVSGITRIRNMTKKCRKIIGWDFNSLYI